MDDATVACQPQISTHEAITLSKHIGYMSVPVLTSNMLHRPEKSGRVTPRSNTKNAEMLVNIAALRSQIMSHAQNPNRTPMNQPTPNSQVTLSIHDVAKRSI